VSTASIGQTLYERTGIFMYIVEIEAGVWLAPWSGDPGRTLVRDSAKRFRLASSAFKALSEACEYRNFDNAKVIPVPSHNKAMVPTS
jgi:hypothetical protein